MLKEQVMQTRSNGFSLQKALVGSVFQWPRELSWKGKEIALLLGEVTACAALPQSVMQQKIGEVPFITLIQSVY